MLILAWKLLWREPIGNKIWTRFVLIGDFGSYRLDKSSTIWGVGRNEELGGNRAERMVKEKGIGM